MKMGRHNLTYMLNSTYPLYTFFTNALSFPIAPVSVGVFLSYVIPYSIPPLDKYPPSYQTAL